MTEPLQNSKRKITDTLVNTDGRTKPSPTNPFTDPQNEPPYPYSSRQNSTRMTDLPSQDFQLSIQHIMPLLSAIKLQNQHFNAEKQTMQTDMNKLQSLSQCLLIQNQNLRKHYIQRTSDIRKLIETITLNTDQQIIDVNHQSHLLKESNCILVKKIEEQMKIQEQINQINQTKTVELQSISQSAFQLQQRNRDMKIKNKELASKLQVAKQEASLHDSSSYDQDINELLMEVTKLRNYNLANILKAKQIQTEHKEQKPLLKDNYISVATHNKQLQAQVRQLKQTANNVQKKLEAIQDNYQKSRNQSVQAYETFYKVRTQLQQQQQTLVTMRKFLEDTLRSKTSSIEQLNRTKLEKNKLSQELLTRKEKLKALKEEQRQAQQKIKQKQQTIIDKIRAQTALQNNTFNQQLKKITSQQTLITTSIQQTKQQFATIVQTLNEQQTKLNRLQNPIREIIRLQYRLKRTQ